MSCRGLLGATVLLLLACLLARHALVGDPLIRPVHAPSVPLTEARETAWATLEPAGSRTHITPCRRRQLSLEPRLTHRPTATRPGEGTVGVPDEGDPRSNADRTASQDPAGRSAQPTKAQVTEVFPYPTSAVTTRGGRVYRRGRPTLRRRRCRAPGPGAPVRRARSRPGRAADGPAASHRAKPVGSRRSSSSSASSRRITAPPGPTAQAAGQGRGRPQPLLAEGARSQRRHRQGQRGRACGPEARRGADGQPSAPSPSGRPRSSPAGAGRRSPGTSPQQDGTTTTTTAAMTASAATTPPATVATPATTSSRRPGSRRPHGGLERRAPGVRGRLTDDPGRGAAGQGRGQTDADQPGAAERRAPPTTASRAPPSSAPPSSTRRADDGWTRAASSCARNELRAGLPTARGTTRSSGTTPEGRRCTRRREVFRPGGRRARTLDGRDGPRAPGGAPCRCRPRSPRPARGGPCAQMADDGNHPRAATSWSASTARRSGSARSGGRPRRPPGAARHCGSCTRPPISVPASIAGAPPPELPRARGITAVAYTVARHTESGRPGLHRGRARTIPSRACCAPRRPVSCWSWAARPPGPPTRWCWPPGRPGGRPLPRAGRRRPAPPRAAPGRTAGRGDPRRRRPGRRRGGRRVRRDQPPSGPASRCRCCRPATAQQNVAASWVDDPDAWAQRFPGPGGHAVGAAGRPGQRGARRRLPVPAAGDQHRPRHPAAPLAGRPAPLVAAALHLADGAGARRCTGPSGTPAEDATPGADTARRTARAGHRAGSAVVGSSVVDVGPRLAVVLSS